MLEERGLGLGKLRDKRFGRKVFQGVFQMADWKSGRDEMLRAEEDLEDSRAWTVMRLELHDFIMICIKYLHS